MKLAIVSPFFPEISGVGQYGVRLAQGLARTRRFAGIHVLANSSPGGAAIEQQAGLTVERLWQRDRLTVLPTLLRALGRLRPDVVWFNLGLSIYGKSPLANFLGHAAPWLARMSGLPTVVTLHELFDVADLRRIGAASNPIMFWGGRLATRMILQADQVCFTLKPYARWAARRYSASNVSHIPHGVFDTPAFKPLPVERRVLFFGLHAPYKGLAGFLEMFSQLRAADRFLRLTVAGSDHPRFPGYFESMRSAHAHLPGITWLTNIPEDRLPGIFESAQVVALPYEAATGASSVTLRAAAHGRPVVAYDLRDLKTLAADQDLQVSFVPTGDEAAFKSRLLGLLQEPGECERIGRANVRAAQSYTLEATSQRYVELFERVVRSRGALLRPKPPGWPTRQTED